MKKKALSLVLALVLCLSLVPMQAFADRSTTTGTDAGPDKEPHTEIYTVTKEPGDDYPYYGAKNEPKKGVYYGRTCHVDTLSNGQYGLTNESQMTNESAVGFYYAPDATFGLEYWSYAYGSVGANKDRAFLVYINVAQAADFVSYANGQFDSILTKDFTYLSTLKNPVFLRFGGEMNAHIDIDPQQYIAAFRHVADLAHRTAPNVAMVFSPNYGSYAAGVDMDSYYPGDAYVDWVGVSLYYNCESSVMPGEISDQNQRFFGTGIYGDALLNVQLARNLAKLHNKPLMATEGGASNVTFGKDTSADAAARMEKAFAFLPMVYPEIKCIVSSDYKYEWDPFGYQFYDNSVVTAAYRKAIANNPTYLSEVGGDASYYTKLSSFKGTWEGNMRFAAYTYFTMDKKPTATWSVDGQTKATVSEYPYTFDLDVDALSGGNHTLAVTFSNGATKSYSFTVKGTGTTEPEQPTNPEQPTKPQQPTTILAIPTNDKLTVDGKAAVPAAFKIDSANYFKIRDVAALLEGTDAEFSVDWDAEANAAAITTGQAYTRRGDELQSVPTGNSMALRSQDVIYINGVKAELTIYKINQDNYIKLRDLAKAVGFNAGWDGANGSMFIESDKPYTDAD